jgi:hypothetical protein
MRDERAKQIIEVWKVVVGVQQHFNDISMRIRSMFVTILLALFASIGFLLDKKLSLEFWIIHIQFATLVPLFGMLGTFLFYFIDRYWYHRLLMGSVKHAIIIESKYKSEIPELSLSEAIGAESPYNPRGIVRWLAKLLVKHDKFGKTGQLHSDGKIELFYKSVAVALFLTTIMLACLGGLTIDKKAAPVRAPVKIIKSTPHAAPADLPLGPALNVPRVPSAPPLDQPPLKKPN